MRVQVIPQPPARPDGPAFDPATGTLLASAEDLERLAGHGSAELEAAGAVVAGRPHPALRGALAAIAAPQRVLVVQRLDGIGRAWVGAETAALALPAGDGRLALVAVDAARVDEAIASACGLDRRWAAPRGETVRVAVDVLARQLAERAVTGLPAEVRQHWRVVDPSTVTAVEVVIAGAGAWLVVPDGAEVELRPASGEEVLRVLRED